MLDYRILSLDEKMVVNREMKDRLDSIIRKAIIKFGNEVHQGNRCANCFCRPEYCTCDMFVEEFNLIMEE